MILHLVGPTYLIELADLGRDDVPAMFPDGGKTIQGLHLRGWTGNGQMQRRGDDTDSDSSTDEGALGHDLLQRARREISVQIFCSPGAKQPVERECV